MKISRYFSGYMVGVVFFLSFVLTLTAHSHHRISRFTLPHDSGDSDSLILAETTGLIYRGHGQCSLSPPPKHWKWIHGSRHRAKTLRIYRHCNFQRGNPKYHHKASGRGLPLMLESRGLAFCSGYVYRVRSRTLVIFMGEAGVGFTHKADRKPKHCVNPKKAKRKMKKHHSRNRKHR